MGPVKLGLDGRVFPSAPPRVHKERGKKLPGVELLTRASEEQHPTNEKLTSEIQYGSSNIRRVMLSENRELSLVATGEAGKLTEELDISCRCRLFSR